MPKVQSIGLPSHLSSGLMSTTLDAMFMLDWNKLRYNEYHLTWASDARFVSHALETIYVDDAKELFRREALTLLLNFLTSSRTLRLLLPKVRNKLGSSDATAKFDAMIQAYDKVDGYNFVKFLRDYTLHQNFPVFQAIEHDDGARSIGLALDGYEKSGKGFRGGAKRFVTQIRERGEGVIDINSLVVTSGADLYSAAHALHLAFIEELESAHVQHNG